MELKLLQPRGNAMATTEAIITGELLDTVEVEIQSVQITLDGRSLFDDRRFVCWTSS